MSIFEEYGAFNLFSMTRIKKKYQYFLVGKCVLSEGMIHQYMYLQMKLAQKYGVSGLLVFCHPDDCPDKTEFSTPANHLPGEEQLKLYQL